MPAKSVAQRKFMGMVRATQKGEMDNPSPELERAAKDMGAKAVNKFAKTKEKNLPQKIGEHKEEKKKNCGCGKDPCITYGPKKNAHKMPDGTLDTGKTHTSSSVRIFHLNELPTKAAKAKARRFEFKLK